MQGEKGGKQTNDNIIGERKTGKGKFERNNVSAHAKGIISIIEGLGGNKSKENK